VKFIVEGYPAYAYTGGQPFDPARPAVLMVHGAAMDHSVWHYPARYLAHHGFGALAVDLPGHGRSPGLPRASVGALATWLASLMDSAGLAKAHVAGHSLGSLVALQFALDHPGRVARLALLGASAPMPVGEPFLAAARDDSPAAFDMQATWGHGRLGVLSTSPIPGLCIAAAGRQLAARARPGVQFTDLKACLDWVPPIEAIRSLATPTLVIAGRRDQMTPLKAGEALAREIPGARLVIADAGHSLTTEAPRFVTHALHDHFAA
jgi:pimeloyl-ACP methyl ester carboxylesterase